MLFLYTADHQAQVHDKPHGHKATEQGKHLLGVDGDAEKHIAVPLDILMDLLKLLMFQKVRLWAFKYTADMKLVLEFNRLKQKV